MRKILLLIVLFFSFNESPLQVASQENFDIAAWTKELKENTEYQNLLPGYYEGWFTYDAEQKTIIYRLVSKDFELNSSLYPMGPGQEDFLTEYLFMDQFKLISEDLHDLYQFIADQVPKDQQLDIYFANQKQKDNESSIGPLYSYKDGKKIAEGIVAIQDQTYPHMNLLVNLNDQSHIQSRLDQLDYHINYNGQEFNLDIYPQNAEIIKEIQTSYFNTLNYILETEFNYQELYQEISLAIHDKMPETKLQVRLNPPSSEANQDSVNLFLYQSGQEIDNNLANLTQEQEAIYVSDYLPWEIEQAINQDETLHKLSQNTFSYQCSYQEAEQPFYIINIQPKDLSDYIPDSTNDYDVYAYLTLQNQLDYEDFYQAVAQILAAETRVSQIFEAHLQADSTQQSYPLYQFVSGELSYNNLNHFVRSYNFQTAYQKVINEYQNDVPSFSLTFDLSEEIFFLQIADSDISAGLIDQYLGALITANEYSHKEEVIHQIITDLTKMIDPIIQESPQIQVSYGIAQAPSQYHYYTHDLKNMIPIDMASVVNQANRSLKHSEGFVDWISLNFGSSYLNFIYDSETQKIYRDTGDNTQLVDFGRKITQEATSDEDLLTKMGIRGLYEVAANKLSQHKLDKLLEREKLIYQQLSLFFNEKQ